MADLHKTKSWMSKRKKVLRRDEYQCQECKQYGKHKEATAVHHINCLRDRPDLGLKSWNLVSLCGDCHDKMHARVSDELTELGMQWVERAERMRMDEHHRHRFTKED